MAISGLTLLKTVICNSRFKEMNKNMIGHTFSEQIKPVLPHEVSDFYDATENKNKHVSDSVIPPFYITKLIIPFMKEIWVHPDLNMNLLKMVHAEQEIICHNVLKTGDPLHCDMEITDIIRTRAGELLRISFKIIQNNTLCINGIAGLMVRCGGKSKKTTSPKSAKTKSFTINIPTWDGQQLKYAKATGDNNFIHTNNFLAKMAGLPRTVMHGTCVMTMCTDALCNKLIDNNVTRIISSSCRFSKPAIPGDTLILNGYDEHDANQIHYDVYNSKGSFVLRHGLFTYKS